MYSHCERDYIASLKNYMFVILRQPEAVVCRSVVFASYHNTQLRQTSIRLLQLIALQGLLSNEETAALKAMTNATIDCSLSSHVLVSCSIGVAAILIPLLLYHCSFWLKALLAVCVVGGVVCLLLHLRSKMIKQYQHAIQPSAVDVCSHHHRLHNQMAPVRECALPHYDIDLSKPAEIQVGDVWLCLCKHIACLQEWEGSNGWYTG